MDCMPPSHHLPAPYLSLLTRAQSRPYKESSEPKAFGTCHAL
jgi:hypothetical protein